MDSVPIVYENLYETVNIYYLIRKEAKMKLFLPDLHLPSLSSETSFVKNNVVRIGKNKKQTKQQTEHFTFPGQSNLPNWQQLPFPTRCLHLND